MKYSSQCKCRRFKLSITLPQPIESYSPRECDCDFCQNHNLIYLSDPDGNISLSTSDHLNQLKQGSEQAVFWQCPDCKNILMVTHQYDDSVRGTINANLLSKQYDLQKPITVSPRLLSHVEKRKRWLTAWSKVFFKSN